MFNLIRKSYPHLRHSFTNSPTHQLHILQLKHLLSSLITQKPTSENSKDHSFTVNYLINKCGFAPEKAISASKYVNVNNPDKADAVIAFFKNQGLSDSQVLLVIKRFPPVICCDPEKTLLPKIEFFLSQGVSNAELPKILVGVPEILKTNLDRKIIPAFNCLKELVGSAQDTIITFLRDPKLLAEFHDCVVPNIEILRKAYVPEARITSSLKLFPRMFTYIPARFKEAVEEVKKMGFDLSKSTFSVAVNVVIGLRRPAWKKKMSVYEKWGCSEDEVLAAFVTNPWCMSVSEDKIDRIMGFFVNEMGWESSRLMHSSLILSMSLNQRIIPRCSVYRMLHSIGFIKKHLSLYTLLCISEEKFRKSYVECYEKVAPDLTKLYQEKMKL